jgi:hypothetical protein
MDNATQEFLAKKESLLDLLRYIEKQNLWHLATHLIKFIESSDEYNIHFLDLLSNLIS